MMMSTTVALFGKRILDLPLRSFKMQSGSCRNRGHLIQIHSPFLQIRITEDADGVGINSSSPRDRSTARHRREQFDDNH
jgi:hypothetical protein